MIIYADAAQDSEGRFDDLCVLRKQLLRKSLHLYIPTLSRADRHFATECDASPPDGRAETKPYPLWSFASGVLEGCITRNANDRDCSSPDTGGYRSRLFILKPSINEAGLAPHIKSCLAAFDQSAQSHSEGTQFDSLGCRDAFAQAQQAQPGLPKELFGFLVRNWDVRKDGHLLFPQHQTWKMTLNSSAWLFGAYKALAAWHTQQLLDGFRQFKKNPAKKKKQAAITETAPIKRSYLEPLPKVN